LSIFLMVPIWRASARQAGRQFIPRTGADDGKKDADALARP
jgi:hypothetical protein